MSYLLKVANGKKDIIRYFGEKEEIIYRLIDAPPLKLYGTIDRVEKDSLLISGSKVAISELYYISSKAQKKEMRFVYAMLTLAGTLTTSSGALLLTLGTAATTVVGVASIVIGAPLIISGIKKYFASNYLKPEKGWVIETVQLGGIPSFRNLEAP